jgi:hypothetical protein
LSADKLNFEVKFLMRSDQVLGFDGDLVPQVSQCFDTADKVTRIRMQFLDSKEHALHKAGWNVRIRRFEGEDEVELTYKRRYPFGDGTLATTQATAARDGFDASESDYAPQVEWGAKRKTLTLSRRKKFAEGGYQGLDLPNSADTRTMSTNELPGKLAQLGAAGWAKHILESGHVFGPVQGKRWAGKWSGYDLSIEYWKLDQAAEPSGQRIVEVSFKHDEEAQASAGSDALAG